MGRQPKTVKELKLTGQYRKDKHGDRCDAELTPGQPRMPKWIGSVEGKQLWRRVVPPLCKAGIAAQEDGDALAAMCWWYGEFRGAVKMEPVSLAEKERAINIARKSWDECLALMRRFGLTPSDRASLKIGKVDDRSAKELKYFG